MVDLMNYRKDCICFVFLAEKNVYKLFFSIKSLNFKISWLRLGMLSLV